MKKTILLFLVSAAASFATEYTIDSTHSSANFAVKHLMVSNVRGQFSKVTGTISYDPANLEKSSVNATIDAATVDTRDAQRDQHLKSPDFLDTAKFPAITFKSKQFIKSGKALKIKGDLTIHGVTKEVVLDVDGPTPELKSPFGDFRVGASASTKISRKDFGLVWNKALETGGMMVGDEVVITLDLETSRK
jgi:polyisoprenoid-binding protein YceI